MREGLWLVMQGSLLVLMLVMGESNLRVILKVSDAPS